ncbi:13226_t:CDS:2 [Gigaspora margarita]|uniref:13226_t:CDS:1 n=1 Tax=Gigaspora margarita TaxID=4874 RepID=A0ABM8VX30_GIGMA|nr:13226_t:CDS:2 [Gigaspora margarita]
MRLINLTPFMLIVLALSVHSHLVPRDKITKECQDAAVDYLNYSDVKAYPSTIDCQVTHIDGKPAIDVITEFVRNQSH